MDAESIKRRIDKAESIHAAMVSAIVPPGENGAADLAISLAIDAKFLLSQVERLSAILHRSTIFLRKALWLAKEIGDSHSATHFVPLVPQVGQIPMCGLCEKLGAPGSVRHEDNCAKYRAQRLTTELEGFLKTKAPSSPDAGEAFVAEKVAGYERPYCPDVGTRLRRRFEKFTPLATLPAGLEGFVWGVEDDGTVWGAFEMNGWRIFDVVAPGEVDVLPSEGQPK